MRSRMTTYAIFIGVALGFFIYNAKLEGAFAQGNILGQQVEERIIQGINEQKTSIDLSDYNIDKEQISDIYYSTYYKNPQLFVATYKNYTYNSKGKVTKIGLTYDYTKEQTEKMLSDIERERDNILSGITDDMSQMQKALYVHDYFCINYEYNYDVYEDSNKGIKNDYNIYGVMVNKKGVCMGYALAYVYVMQSLGIETSMVRSDKEVGGMNHAWNMIKIDDNYYHIDIVWDDKVRDTEGYACHENFLLSDKEIEANGHYRWNSDGKKATSEKYDNYFWKNTYTGFIYNKNKCYYVDNAEKSIKEYDFKNNISKNVYSLKNEKWKVIGSDNKYYVGCYARLAVLNDKLYFNTASGIYELNTIENTAKLVYISPYAKNTVGWIYGLARKNGQLIYQIKNSMGTSDIGTIYVANDLETYTNTTNVNTLRSSANVACTTSTKNEVSQQMVNISKAKIKLSYTKCTYNAKKKRPTVYVTSGSKKLILNEDYKITYKNNIKPGTATVIINGIGDYKGKVIKKFTISMPKISNLKVSRSSKKVVKITWSRTRNITKYEIQKATSKNGKYKTIKSNISSSKISEKISIKSGKRYYYRVRAYKLINGKKYYTYSSIKSCK